MGLTKAYFPLIKHNFSSLVNVTYKVFVFSNCGHYIICSVRRSSWSTESSQKTGISLMLSFCTLSFQRCLISAYIVTAYLRWTSRTTYSWTTTSEWIIFTLHVTRIIQILYLIEVLKTSKNSLVCWRCNQKCVK